jgi:dihydrofolate reductase
MTRPRFTLLVVASADGFIARTPGESPATWASAEEQALFLDRVARADWSVMGRATHEAADRPDRRRVVFSSRGGGWVRPTQLWLDPAGLTPDDLAARVEAVRPMRDALILGGTRVHDWFLAHGRIDAVDLTVEPVTFGTGLPIFSGQDRRDPVAAFAAHGFRVARERALNATGTRLIRLDPAGS